MKNVLHFTTIALALAIGTTANAQLSCPEFAALAQSALPASVGTSQLVTGMLSGAGSFTEDGLSALFDHRTAGKALEVRLKPARTCPRKRDRRESPETFACEYGDRSNPRLSLDVDMQEGRLTFLDGTRGFEPDGPDNTTTNAAALDAAQIALKGLGLPPNEISLANAKVAARMMASAPRDGSEPPTIRRMEVVATVPRLVNGYPVHDSRASVAVGVDGRPARVHVVWPDFDLAPGLGAAMPLNRTELVQQIVETMGEFAGSCAGFDRMKVRVGWIPGAVADLSDESGAPQDGGRYLPGVAVKVAPPDSGEDSGQFEDFVRSFTVALVGNDPGTSDG